ncbi:Fe(3+) ABC transporter substrate-binding protein [Idiomarina sp. HP20-50]|uniref:Fe(3+) ABC transporter substrate-binding protein n=1 Tax=Idiomarina sp. HP20-50 TaxID=3070813 RepID=UPI00294B12BF|nr:Fe(3+) ABC transporter substrate-binding protein [Idiomarina sp. HP20-50]MDV6316889.1 Fe(3+) ABC transporter substrate-binding protein [Idiomarina sp. HP20-50]
MRKFTSLLAILAATSATLVSFTSAAAEVNIYSARKEALIKPVLEKFTQQTGIEVNLLTGNADALLARLNSEGKNTPADLFLTVDAGALHRAVEAGAFQPVTSDIISEAVPSHFRSSDNLWVGLSLRARPIFYSPERVDPEELESYLSLADEKWNDRICIRSSNNLYNQSLVAALIEHHGIEKTEKWAEGFVENFARSPVGGDRDQIKGIAFGICDVAIANTYYFGHMLNSDNADERAAAEKVDIFWPAQDKQGTHVNVSGIGITKHAKNVEEAQKLIQFLVSKEAQEWYAQVNYEYPVREGVEWSNTLQKWGDFKQDDIPMDVLGENNDEAVRLMNRAGWR